MLISCGINFTVCGWDRMCAPRSSSDGRVCEERKSQHARTEALEKPARRQSGLAVGFLSSVIRPRPSSEVERAATEVNVEEEGWSWRMLTRGSGSEVE